MAKVAVAEAGQEQFGIDINRVVEILRAQRIHLLPRLPAFLAGVVNVRGEVIPILDIRRRFGINPSRRKERIIVIRSENEKVGLLVDGVRDIVDLQPAEISEPPLMFRGLKTEYLTGIARKGDSIIILLNIDMLLSSEEKIELEEMPGSGEAEDGRI